MMACAKTRKGVDAGRRGSKLHGDGARFLRPLAATGCVCAVSFPLKQVRVTLFYSEFLQGSEGKSGVFYRLLVYVSPPVAHLSYIVLSCRGWFDARGGHARRRPGA